MDAQLVLTKTDKGAEELRLRKHGLDRALRPVLILVDGQSTVGEVMQKGAGLPDLERCLIELELKGFIARKAHSASDIQAVKPRLIAVAEEVLGAKAAKITAKLQKAPDTREGLLEVVAGCKKLVELLIDEDKAAVLQDRCEEVLAGL